MKSLRAVLVDMDGTLASTSEANWVAYGRALYEAGVVLSREQFLERARSRNWREFLPEILEEFDVEADPAAIAHRKTEIYRTLLDTVSVNWPLVRLLEALRPHMATALVTTASAASVEALLRVHGLARHFDLVVTGDDVRRHKPDPEAFEIAASRLGVEPDECLVYEDSDEGVTAANLFGAHVIRIVL
ncbi:MAG: HAD family phosphatase [Fimbriimonas sp.]|nr:HAD family phosphatase [Fimbriimonas sp.]